MQSSIKTSDILINNAYTRLISASHFRGKVMKFRFSVQVQLRFRVHVHFKFRVHVHFRFR